MPLAPHFDVAEAKAIAAIAANLEGPTPPLPMPAIPASWGATPLFDSPLIGTAANKWQLWANPTANQYAVVIRGTIDTSGSIFEDLLAVMIPATGTLPLGSVSLPYNLAHSEKAGVHLGFFLGAAVLLFDGVSGILQQLNGLPDGAEILISGHSQGAAIATLCRSFLEYSNVLAAKGFTYKTYVIAQPKPGNDHYGWDFEEIVRATDSGFRIGNSLDWVPQVPLTLQLLASLNDPNPLDALTGQALFKLLSSGVETLQAHLTEVHLAKHLPQIQALEQILKAQNLQTTAPSTTGNAIQVLPTLNFVNCGTPVTLPGTPGGNPANPNDYFWQHHAAMYYNLLSAAP
jgi:hypothetical protein